MTKATAFRLKSSAMLSGSLSAFRSRFRDGEKLLAEPGIVVTYETVGRWYLTFGQTSANELRRRRPPCGDTWHLDEVVLTIGGQKHS